MRNYTIPGLFSRKSRNSLNPQERQGYNCVEREGRFDMNVVLDCSIWNRRPNREYENLRRCRIFPNGTPESVAFLQTRAYALHG